MKLNSDVAQMVLQQRNLKLINAVIHSNTDVVQMDSLLREILMINVVKYQITNVVMIVLPQELMK